jgi:aldehyde dehydrogenase (NAD+)
MRTTFEALCYLLDNELPYAKNFIGGSFLNAACGEWLDSEEPATGRVWLKVANSNGSDVDLAVTAATNAFSR